MGFRGALKVSLSGLSTSTYQNLLQRCHLDRLRRKTLTPYQQHWWATVRNNVEHAVTLYSPGGMAYGIHWCVHHPWPPHQVDSHPRLGWPDGLIFVRGVLCVLIQLTPYMMSLPKLISMMLTVNWRLLATFGLVDGVYMQTQSVQESDRRTQVTMFRSMISALIVINLLYNEPQQPFKG